MNPDLRSKFIDLRENATAAHVGPLAVFMLLSLVPAWVRIDDDASPWYLRHPEHWLYPIQSLVCGWLLWQWRHHYEIHRCPIRFLILALLFAGVGILVWIAPGWLFDRWGGNGDGAPSALRYLGFTERSRGFDPNIFEEDPLARILTLISRFLRSVVIVSFVEELCWRGWLMRAVIARDKPFTEVPFGTHSWQSYGITTLAVALIHKPEDWLVAFIWGSLVYLLAVKSRSLSGCLFMHAVGNLLLGIYVLKTAQYGYW